MTSLLGEWSTPTEPPIDAYAPANEAGGHSIKILIAEDNLINRRVLLKMLERVGDVTSSLAENGLEAVEAARHEPFDIVFMDLHMPQMDGFEAAERILEEASDPKPTIIAVTTATQTESRARCKAIGFVDFLSKPVRFADLREAFVRNGFALSQ